MFTINHICGQNCMMKLDEYPRIFYKKKWWLEHTFQDEQGRNVQFRGWINTDALDPHDFPDTLEGTFWASKVEENGFLRDGEIGMMGHFDIGFGEQGNYVIGSVYPIYLSENVNYQNNPTRIGAEAILNASIPLNRFPRFEANIQDCLVEKKTYIQEIRL